MKKVFSIEVTHPLKYTREIVASYFHVGYRSVKRIDAIRKAIYKYYLLGFTKIRIAIPL